MSFDVGEHVRLTAGPDKGQMGQIIGYDDDYFGEYIVELDGDGEEIVVPEDGLAEWDA